MLQPPIRRPASDRSSSITTKGITVDATGFAIITRDLDPETLHTCDMVLDPRAVGPRTLHGTIRPSKR
jgi:hypothetical protein